eukprot:scaffold28747_cov53-Phaeocystis_antarctica.AAC.1
MGLRIKAQASAAQRMTRMSFVLPPSCWRGWSGDISQPRDRVRRELESALKAALRKGVKSAIKAYGASVAHRWRIGGRSMFSLTLVRLVCLCEAVAGVGLVSYFTVVSPLKRLH